MDPRKVNCQTIRQSVVTNLLKAGNDLRIVQVFAGHKYPSTTERYKQTNVEALKMAISIYHPIK
ncbi:MAG: tyrosine-type recombinase/integrase [Cytophagaceae bacterium]|nr:tyrosine-type recombinase/integrase [Cytophagaceae bacterium]